MVRSNSAAQKEKDRQNKNKSYHKSIAEVPGFVEKTNERKKRERHAREARKKALLEAAEAIINASTQEHHGPAPVLPPPPNDLVDGVRGVSADHRSKTVTWGNGVETVLPYLPVKSKKIPGQHLAADTPNVLEDDADDVAGLAKSPVATPDSPVPCIQFFTYQQRCSSTFMADLRAALSKGKFVVLPGFQEDEKMPFSMQAIKDCLGLASGLKVAAHDLRKRVSNQKNPTSTTTLGTCVKNAEKPSVIQMVLDIHVPHRNMPKGLENLDDGLCIGWGQSALGRPAEPIYTSSFTESSWALVHHGGTYTYPHQDTQGCITLVEAMAGTKFWGIVKMDPAVQAELSTVTSVVEKLDQVRIDPNACTFVVQANPGDVMIQPPGTFHTVYTPVPSVFAGRFLYTYDTMHLTEVSQRLNIMTKGAATNQDIELQFATFCLLAIGLPLQTDRVFYRRSLVALCMIVILPELYHPEVFTNKERPSCYPDAETVLVKVLRGLGFKAQRALLPEELNWDNLSNARRLAKVAKAWYDRLSPSQQYDDPGEVVRIAPFFKQR